jgi:hypothetical protein
MSVSVCRSRLVGLVSVCVLIGAFGLFGSSALAAAPEAPETTAATEVSNTTARLEGILNPHVTAPIGGSFAYQVGAAGCGGANTTPLQPEVEAEDFAIAAQVTDLRPGTEYSFCLVARNAAEETTAGAPVSFITTALPPEVDDEFATEPGSTSMQVNARLNLRGSGATYSFEYGTSEAYGASTATHTARAAASDVGVSAQLTGLQPNTTYHARVLADGEFGRSAGTDFSFSTLPVTEGLPDDRAYEMVTPADNEDADIYAPAFEPFTGIGPVPIGTPAPFQAAASGEAVTYAGDPVDAGNGSGGASIDSGNQLLARRSSSGWTQEVVAATGLHRSFYEAFSPELSVGVLNVRHGAGEPGLLPEADAFGADYHVLYARENDTHHERALFTEFTQPEPPGPFEFAPVFVGGSNDFSTLVFDAPAALTPGAPAGKGVYESKLGQLSLVNVLPDGSIEPSAQAGGTEEAGGEGYGLPEFGHAVSADGSRIFWTGTGSNPNLYVREAGSTTVQLDASQAGGAGGGGHFLAASADGEKVFFSDDAAAGLTSDTVPGSGANLYEYDFSDRRLTDLTAAAEAQVAGVLGASEDGAYIYFVANGVLASGAQPGECQRQGLAYGMQCSLYVRHAGRTTFISRLSELDGVDVSPYFNGPSTGFRGDWVGGAGNRSADVSASGALVFDSELGLTGYGSGAEEVYTYDPLARSGEGDLECASCDPSGARPQGAMGGTVPVSNDADRVTRAISADGGRVFFDSDLALLPQDTNGKMDVYEWERDGSGDCELTKGCLSLLTGGTSDDSSFLLDSSASGDDVFMVTRAQLVEADRNENFDVYDARVGGARQLAASACSGSGCQGVPPSPASFATPASFTFEGLGNFSPPPTRTVKPKSLTRAQLLSKALKACAKLPRKRRAPCESRARKRYGTTTKTKRSTKTKTKRSAKGGK